jgi:uroporphyrinogen decarboxylase
MQIEAGADIVQIFDTWAGILAPDDFSDFSLQYIGDIVRDVKKRTNNRAPVIVFCKGANLSLLEIVGTGCDVIGLDWTIDIAEAKALIGDEVALQGNLDIFNLGHGITPDVDPDRARAFVKFAKEAYR